MSKLLTQTSIENQLKMPTKIQKSSSKENSFRDGGPCACLHFFEVYVCTCTPYIIGWVLYHVSKAPTNYCGG